MRYAFADTETRLKAPIFICHRTAPGQADIPVCEVFELRNGLIRSSRAYNNATDFPAPEAC